MQILIFEGIATSGKSMVIKELVSALPATLGIKVIGEEETHLPIIKETSSLHLDFYKSLINKAVSEEQDLAIFDRLYLTQAFRAGVKLDAYVEIEELLLPHLPTTIFLRVDEDGIAERIREAIAHRSLSWADYVKTKGQDINEIAEYYINQQVSQLKLLNASVIPYQIFSATNHNYPCIVNKIWKSILSL